jgi:hypothetical protein
VQYSEINRGPYAQEMEKAFESASAAGLWRFDERWSIASYLVQ